MPYWKVVIISSLERDLIRVAQTRRQIVRFRIKGKKDPQAKILTESWAKTKSELQVLIQIETHPGVQTVSQAKEGNAVTIKKK